MAGQKYDDHVILAGWLQSLPDCLGYIFSCSLFIYKEANMRLLEEFLAFFQKRIKILGILRREFKLVEFSVPVFSNTHQNCIKFAFRQIRLGCVGRQYWNCQAYKRQA